MIWRESQAIELPVLTFPSMCDEDCNELNVALHLLGRLPRRGRKRPLIVEESTAYLCANQSTTTRLSATA